MAKENNIVFDTLKHLGFTTSEITVYKTLIENDYLKVQEISKIANVPRTKTYEILQKLEMKDVILKTNTQPVRYKAKNPSYSLKEMKNKLIADTEKGVELLQESWTHLETIDEMRPVDIYYGATEYFKIFNKLEKNVNSHLYMLLSYIIPETDIQVLKSIIKKNKSKGVKVELIFHPKAEKLLDIKTKEFLKEQVNYKVIPIPIRTIFIDSQEFIIQIPSQGVQGVVKPNDINNVIIRLPDLVETIEKSIRASMSQVIPIS